MSATHVADVAANEVELGELLANSSDEAETRGPFARTSSRPLLAVLAAAGCGVGLIALACIKHIPPALASPHADPSAAISLQAFTTALPVLPSTPVPGATALPGFVPTSSPLEAMCNPKPASAISAMQRTENKNDGNPCRDSEEKNGGLCYRKCACLTGNPIATRMTAFSCCVTDDCTDMTSWDTPSLEPCTGHDVSSADGGAACPHQLGACLEDEEQSFGMCFKRCSLINSAYPFRVNALTCCKANPTAEMGCQPLVGDPNLYATGEEYNIGGGCGDSDPTDTPCQPHGPLTSQTESTA